MTDPARWQSDNNEYLAASLEWLRLLLLRAAGSQAAETETDKRGCLMFWQRPVNTAPRLKRVSQKQIDNAKQARAEAAQKMEPPPALQQLSQRFAMSEFEQDLVLLCAGVELDTTFASLCAAAQGESGRNYPTFALAMSLLDNPAWDVLSPNGPLRYWRLLEINQPGTTPLTISALRIDERILNFVKGLNYPDDRLTPLVRRMALFDDVTPLPESQSVRADAIRKHINMNRSPGRAPVIQLAGAVLLSKQLVAVQAARQLGLQQLYQISSQSLAQHAGEVTTLARLWERDSLLLSVGLYVDAHETDGKSPSSPAVAAVQQFLDQMPQLVLLSTREPWPNAEQHWAVIDVCKPTSVEQQTAWSDVLGSEAGNSPRILAGQFNLNIPTICQIAQNAIDGNDDGDSDQSKPELSSDKTKADKLWNACLAHTRPKLESLAQRLNIKATRDDIVLPSAQMELLNQIIAQTEHRTTVYDDWGFRSKMNRGLGISVLFAGDSGTGKTMAAEVIASELRLNLYRIDLSAVVNKYIGETEKNLRRLFDAAEDGGAILFFDEADSLFGKRSEVKDSHDRYANIEINYLLQRMESYGGLAILATNMKSALDTAFMRRLRFVIDFPFPGAEERKLIWQKAFPRRMPQLDFDFLARLNLTGGSIHNIALNAAFLAADAGRKEATMPNVLNAARTEMLKLERHINEAEFQWKEPKREVA